MHITKTYGRDVFDIEDSFIKVTIPFSEERIYGSISNKNKLKNNLKVKRNREMIYNSIKDNPKITTTELMNLTKLGKTSVQKYLKELSNDSIIEHVGPKKGGYWVILK